jgi:hypothetical protein
MDRGFIVEMWVIPPLLFWYVANNQKNTFVVCFVYAEKDSVLFTGVPTQRKAHQ